MKAITLTQEHRAAAPALGASMCAILMALAALVAHAFLRDPFHVALINPLWTRITRAARRFDRLMARVAAGTEQPRPSRPASRPDPCLAVRSGRRPVVSLPNRTAWLTVALSHHGAGRRSQIEHLLADPRTAEIIAAVPQAVSLLRPICRILGISHPAIPPRPRRQPSAPSAAPAEPARTPAPRRPATGSTAPGFSAADEPYPRPLSETVPCDHVGWPWFPGRFSRNA